MYGGGLTDHAMALNDLCLISEGTKDRNMIKLTKLLVCSAFVVFYVGNSSKRQ